MNRHTIILTKISHDCQVPHIDIKPKFNSRTSRGTRQWYSPKISHLAPKNRLKRLGRLTSKRGMGRYLATHKAPKCAHQDRACRGNSLHRTSWPQNTPFHVTTQKVSSALLQLLFSRIDLSIHDTFAGGFRPPPVATNPTLLLLLRVSHV